MKNNIKFGAFGVLFILAGANIAYSAGAGFGTGQEMMQYFTSYGYYGILGLMISMMLMIFFDVFVISDTRKYKLKNLQSVYTHYSGNVVGNILIVFSFVYLFCMAAIMIAGSGAAFNEYFGIAPIIGRAIMAFLVFITVIFGLKKTVNVIGSLGPFIAIFIVIIGLVALVTAQTGLGAGNEYLKTHEVTYKPSENWLLAALMYFSFAALFRAPYMNGISNKDSTPVKQLIWGNIIGGLLVAAIALIMLLSHISNISILDGVQVPNLTLGNLISPIIGALFGVILLAAIYTTAVPLIWAFTDIVTKEGSKLYPWIITLDCVLAFIASGLASFSLLVNIVSRVAAFVGVLFLIPVLYVRFIKKPEPPVESND